MSGKTQTVALIGFGAIGSAVFRRMQAQPDRKSVV